MWFGLRQRARRLGRQSQWESGHGKQHVRVNSIKVLAFPHRLHTLRVCVCASVSEWRACVCPPIYLESCDLTRAVMHSVKSPAIYSRTVLGFPAKHCRTPLIFVPSESARLNVSIFCRCQESTGAPVSIRTREALKFVLFMT